MKTKFEFLTILFLFNLFFISDIYSQSWITQFSGTQSTINDIYFINSNTGFAACDSSILLRTANGGLNWVQVPFNFEARLIKVIFLDQLTGFVFNSQNSGMNSVYKSTNSGINWEINYQHNNPQTFACKLDSVSILISCSINRLLLKTNNSGQNWNVLGATYWDNTVSYFINSQTGWLCSSDLYSAPPQIFQGVLRKTTDGGISWPLVRRETGSSLDMPQSAIAAFSNDTNSNNDTIIYVNYLGHHINKTTNSGNNWQTTVIDNYSINDLKFINSSTGWAAASEGRVYKTTNCGDIWIFGPTPVTSNLKTIYFINDQTGWVAGVGGCILKTTTGGPTSMTGNSEIPENLSLSQNYPNPFNPVTKIRFNLPASVETSRWDVLITIYDVLGKQVQILVDQQLQPGSYENDWDASSYPSGVYYYKLEASLSKGSGRGFTETKKMVLIK